MQVNRPSLALRNPASWILLAGVLTSLVSEAADGAAGSGALSAFLGLGLVPGLVLAALLAPGESWAARLPRAAFLGPLVSGTLATLALLAGFSPATAARGILVLSYAGGAATLLTRRPGPALSRDERRLLWWLAVLAGIVLTLHLTREWVRVRSDAHFHTAVVHEIDARGVPPRDPYFAGLPLQYLWVYHALVAVWSEATRTPPWNAGGPLNALWLVALAGGAFRVSRRVGRTEREALFAAVFVPLGLDALFYLGFPLKALRALVGETAGWDELVRTFTLSPFTFDRLWHVTSTFGSPPALFNKYLVMTAFGGGVAALVWLADGLVDAVQGGRARALTAVALATAAAWIWHPGTGLAATLAGALSGLVLWIWHRGIPWPRVLLGAVGMAVGTAAVLPLLLDTGARAHGVFPLGLSPALPAILMGSLAALGFGVPMLWRGTSAPAAHAFRVFAMALMAATVVVRLPGPNTADKMPFVFYLLPAVAAGWWWAAWCGRPGRRALRVAALLAVLLPVNVLYLAWYAFSPAEPRPGAEAERMYAWFREHTPAEAVVVDSADRDEAVVWIPRRQYWGREPYARQWGYDPEEMNRRRQVRDALLAFPRTTGFEVERAVITLDAFARETGAPLYVVWRPADHDSMEDVHSTLFRRPDRFRVVWHGAEAAVYSFTPATPSEAPARGEP